MKITTENRKWHCGHNFAFELLITKKQLRIDLVIPYRLMNLTIEL